MNDDLTLLREFARDNSEAAFATLVTRHVNLVHSVALRQVRDPQLADEITQAVFIILARKADSLGDKIILSGWLCRTARYASANTLTIQRRRQQREQEAYMQSQLEQSQNDLSRQSETDAEMWNQIAPLLDGALEKLGQKDHDALVLRYFENKSFAEVGASLGASEDAAKMRVSRALEKLRKFFTKRGVTFSSAALAGTISANSVQAAPVALAKSVTAVAIAKGAAASGSTLTLIKGALKIMAWTKMKTTIVASAVVLLAAGTGKIIIQNIEDTEWQTEGLSSGTFQNAPHKTMILQTKGDHRGTGQLYDGSVMGINCPLSFVLQTAYGAASPYRMVADTPLLTQNYDFLSNVGTNSRIALQRAIKKQFGLIGYFETRNTDVLVLEAKQIKSSRLLSIAREPKPVRVGLSPIKSGQLPGIKMDEFAHGLEQNMETIVIDQTGLTNGYRIDFVPPIGSNSRISTNTEEVGHALSEQLGLELVQTNMPIEILVVERVQ